MTAESSDPAVKALLARLRELDISYERVDHSPVYTVAEAADLVPALPGTNAKNLFLRNKSGSRHILLVAGYHTSVDLKGLADVLNEKRLSMASEERLQRHLGVAPGAVSLLALINDHENAVEVIIERSLWNAETIKCHPLVNTSTLALRRTDLARLLSTTGHAVTAMDIPVRGA